MSIRTHTAFAGLIALLFLAACDSAEERVDKLYIEAQDLAANDQPEKAMLVLRNLFDLDGFHRDARLLYAEQAEIIGDQVQAYRHYLLVAEQNPEFTPVRVTLGTLAAEMGDWEETARHVSAAEELGDGSNEVAVLRMGLDYREAIRLNDNAGMEQASQNAEELIEAQPDLILARRILIDNYLRNNQPYQALEAADAALEQAPMDEEINRTKLGILAQTEQLDLVGEHLKVLVDRFPEDATYRSNLINWYLSTDNVQGAEDFIRSLIDPEDDDNSAQFALIQFLRQLRSTDAALEELDRIIAAAEDPLPFERVRAAIVFDTGAQEDAIGRLEQLIAENEQGIVLRDIQATLARMYLLQGRVDDAKTTVKTVLEEDDRHVEALVMNAGWLIEDDQVRDAILTLRTALDQSPEDIPAINMLAAAYERDGNRDLMGETMLLAATTSGFAPDESLRYARFLIAREKLRSAEDVLLRSLRARPDDLRLLQMLGETYLLLSDWPRVEQVIATLERFDTEQAMNVATGLQATLLTRMERTDESIQLLRNVIEEGRGGIAAHAAVVRTHLANAETDAARAYMDEIIAENTDPEATQGLEFLNAALMAVEGNYQGAQNIYRNILEQTPEAEIVWRALVSTVMREGDDGSREQASEILDEALAIIPSSPTLLWMKASMEEANGNVQGAIDIYEEMYAQSSSSAVVANNLASLLTTFQDDDASLQRAYVIARRLRGSQLPAFQDTYGWIAYRMGNTTEAVDYLSRAAAGLPAEPLVQYHLGKALLAVGDADSATAQFEKALELWAGDASLPQIEDARQQLALLSATEEQPQAQ